MNDMGKTHATLFDVSIELDDVVTGIDHAVKTMYYLLEKLGDQSVKNNGYIEHFNFDEYEHILTLCADRIFAEKEAIEKLSRRVMDISKHCPKFDN